jgi:hypothetical protein
MSRGFGGARRARCPCGRWDLPQEHGFGGSTPDDRGLFLGVFAGNPQNRSDLVAVPLAIIRGHPAVIRDHPWFCSNRKSLRGNHRANSRIYRPIR